VGASNPNMQLLSRNELTNLLKGEKMIKLIGLAACLPKTLQIRWAILVQATILFFTKESAVSAPKISCLGPRGITG
jgi:hypothetical protein